MKQDVAARGGRLEDELWGSFFEHNHLLLAAVIALCIFDGLIGSFFSWVLKLILDAIAYSSMEELRFSALLAALSIVLEVAVCLLLREAEPAFLRRAVTNYRTHAFSKLLDKGIGAFDQGGASVYESAFTNDITTIETTYLEKIKTLATDIPMFISALILLFVESVPLAAWAIVCAVLSLWVSVASGKRLAPRQKAVSDEMGRFVAAVHDIIAGFAQIKSFKAEAPAERRFCSANTELEDAKQAKRRCEQGINVIAEAAGSISQVTVLFFGAWLCIVDHAITIGGIMMVTQLMNYIRIPIAELPSVFAARKASTELAAKLASELAHAQAEEGTLMLAPERPQDIELQDVSFGYEEGNPVLQGITAEFEAGKCYAVVGASGSGKSTLLSLLMGAHRDYEGKVTFDGSELHDVSLDSLYGTESLVSQKTFLFDASLKDNITMFGDATDEDLSSAIEQAGLSTFVAAHGLEYACGEEGANLSGGERQRVCIARALLHGARTLLFDEATSALDQKTADQVTRAVLGLSGTTRIMVTHRLDAGLLRGFDGIMVFRDGKVCEAGTFDELVTEPDGYFHALYTIGL
ncbi:MAG: ABC transporter ATP-binding protein [Atopobiaceae bacterium]